jgi:hypothetical protein
MESSGGTRIHANDKAKSSITTMHTKGGTHHLDLFDKFSLLVHLDRIFSFAEIVSIGE